MANDFIVKIVSPSAKVAETRAKSLIIPGSQGFMTILPDHADMVAELGIGQITLTSENQRPSEFFLSGGFVEVEGNEVTVLADVVEKSSLIDLERAKTSRERALERLNKANGSIDTDRANLSLKRAEVRIMIAQTLASVSK
jgi:F-type H+-transporting ATPase subunit epsilon